MLRSILFLSCLASALLATLVAAPDLSAANIVNGGDSWQRESSPAGTFNGDLIAVWSTNSGDDGGANERLGAVEFDLSTHASAITAASLALWSQTNEFTDDSTPHKQSAFVIDPTGLPNADALTYTDVIGAPVHAVLGTLGAYDLPPVDVTPAIQNVYLDSPASAADVAVLEGIRGGTFGGRLMIIFDAAEDGTDYRKSWSDGEWSGEDALLRTNADAIPEPTTMLMSLLALAGIAAVGRRR